MKMTKAIAKKWANIFRSLDAWFTNASEDDLADYTVEEEIRTLSMALRNETERDVLKKVKK